jgi:divalent metal cation (Fe/Co/Zn/Cd) transporter
MYPLRDLKDLPVVSGCTDGCGCTTSSSATASTAADRLWRWAWLLTALTIGWNSLEALIAVGTGVQADSIALVSFGLDSVIEVSSALVIVWRLTRRSTDSAANQRTERRAVRLIAGSFFAIAAYVAVDAVLKLLGMGAEPEQSAVGLALVTLSLVVMPTLAWAKRRVAAGLESAALRADGAQTQLCTYLSAVVLVGLAANALAGWWWMDPLAGLVVAGLAIKEGRAAWSSGELCTCG